MEELSKLESLWSEIRQSQYLTEKEIKKIDSLLKKLEELHSSNSSKIDNLKKLYSNTEELLLKINKTDEKLREKVTNINKDIENNFNQTLNKSINQIKSNIKEKEKELNEFIKNTKKEVEKKTSFQFWELALTTLGLGALLGALIVSFLFKNDIIFGLKYSNTCSYDDNSTYQCYAVPKDKVGLDTTGKEYLIQK